MVQPPIGALDAVLDSFDQSRDQLIARLDGLGDAEYFWEPVPGCWTIRPSGDEFEADASTEDLDPAPVTTIAWRLWHIAVDAMDSYSARAFGTSGTGLEGRAFVGTAAEGVRLVEASIAAFRAGMTERGADGAGEKLGSAWGPYATSTYFDLLLHAHRELTHHGAEVGTLRDIYRWTRAAEG